MVKLRVEIPLVIYIRGSMFLPDCSNFDPKAARTLQPVPSKCLLTLTQLKCNIDFLGGWVGTGEGLDSKSQQL